MALSYIGPGDAIDVLRMNDLWIEFDRKLGSLLSGKSPLVSPRLPEIYDHPTAKALGKVFVFAPASDANLATVPLLEVPRYDHWPFTRAVNNCTASKLDNANRIAWVSSLPVDLDESLEAHRYRLGHWIGLGDYPVSYIRPQRMSWYAVAEVVVEGRTLLDWPVSWNKYGCLRIHNCDRWHGLTVRFGTWELVIPRMECRTVRRFADGTHETGRYFWQYRAGDPCFLNAGTVAQRFPERSFEASNLLNPSIVYHWISLFRPAAKRMSFGWTDDPSDLCDIGAHYKSIYPDPTDKASRLGDLVHPKGELLHALRDGTSTMLTRVQWQGFSKGPARPLRGEWTDGGGYTISDHSGDTADVFQIGTTLLSTTGYTGGAALPVTIPAGVIATSLPTTGGSESTPIAMSYYAAVGSPATARGTIIRRAAGPHPVAISAGLADTVDGLSLRIGAAGWSFAARALTPEGNRMAIRRAIDVSLPGWQETDIDRMDETGFWQDYAWSLGLGWPGSDYPNTTALAPRVQRQLAVMSGSYPSFKCPDLANVVWGPNGADFSVASPPLTGAPVSITAPYVIRPVLDFVNGGTITVSDEDLTIHYLVLPPDNIHCVLARNTEPGWYHDHRDQILGRYDQMLDIWDADQRLTGAPRYVRVPNTMETWNHMAWAVNRISRCVPLSIEDIYWPIGAGKRLLLARNALGLANHDGRQTSYRPPRQFARVDDADQITLCSRLGIPILTLDDITFPSLEDRSYGSVQHEIANTPNVTKYRVHYHCRFGAGTIYAYRDLMPSGLWRYRHHYECPYVWEYDGLEEIGTATGPVDEPAWPSIPFRDTSYRWISADDVAEVAQQLGLAAYWSQAVRPLSVLLDSCAAPSLTNWSPRSVAGVEIQPEVYWGETADGTLLPTVEAAARADLAKIEGTTIRHSVDIYGSRFVVRLAECTDSDADLIADEGYAGLPDDTDSRRDAGFITSEVGEVLDKRLIIQTIPQGAWPAGSQFSAYFAEGVSDVVRSVDYLEKRSLVHLAAATGGMQDDSMAALTSAWSWTRTPKASLASLASANLVGLYGIAGRAPTFHGQDPEKSRIEPVEDGDILTPDRNKGERSHWANIISDLHLPLT